jgi:hypothetical protein
VVLHRLFQVLEALDADLGQRGRERPAQDPGQLDGDQAQVLEGLPAESAAPAGVELRKGRRQVGEGKTPTPGQRQVREVAQPPPQPGRRPRRQGPDDRDQTGQEPADGLLRSCRACTRTGITDGRRPGCPPRYLSWGAGTARVASAAAPPRIRIA